jgi:hypothetical protein
MDFIKKLFDGVEEGLTYEQFKAKADEAGIKFANLSDGKYVSKSKYDSDISAKDLQINDLNGTIATRDNDLADIKAQLEKAGADEGKLSKLSGDLEALQAKYDDDVKSYQAKLTRQEYEFAVKEFANGKQFTSNAAKRDFINSMIAKELKVEDGKILGADDFVTSYSTDNADAFIVESAEPEPAPEPEKPKPHFVTPTGSADPGDTGDQFAFSFTGVRAKED